MVHKAELKIISSCLKMSAAQLHDAPPIASVNNFRFITLRHDYQRPERYMLNIHMELSEEETGIDMIDSGWHNIRSITFSKVTKPIMMVTNRNGLHAKGWEGKPLFIQLSTNLLICLWETVPCFWRVCWFFLCAKYFTYFKKITQVVTVYSIIYIFDSDSI